MRRASRGAALAAVFVSVLLPFPQAGGVHLVSNEHTGTDNQNNAPVQYAPKMASKLGLSQPQNREPEYLSEESLANAIRQLMESNKRQSIFLERLANLTPKFKPEEQQPKKKSSKPPAKSSTKNSDSSVIMRPPKKKPESSVSSEQAKNAEVGEKCNKTEDEPQVVDTSMCPPRNHLPRSHSTLHHRSYMRPGHPVYVPSDSHLLTHMTADHQVLYPQLAGTPPLVQNSQLPQNPYSYSVAVAPLSQDSLTLQTPHTNTPHIQNTHAFQNQYSHNVALTSPGPNPLNPTAPHVQNPSAIQNQYSHNIALTPPGQNPLNPTAPHVQNPSAVQNQYSHNVALTSPGQNPLNPTAPHVQNPSAVRNQYSQKVTLSYPGQNSHTQQNPHSNAVGVTAHIQNPHAQQNPHSSTNVPLYTPTSPHHNIGMLSQKKHQGPYPSVDPLAHQGQNPLTIQAGSHPGSVIEAPHSQDPRMRPLINLNYESGAPLIHNPPFPQGFNPYPISEKPQIQNSPPSPGHPAFNGVYPQNFYSWNSQFGNVGKPIGNLSNGHFLEKPTPTNGRLARG